MANMTKEFLIMEDILKLIRSLALSQGFYGRLLRYIIELRENDPEVYLDLVDEWESKHFKTDLDFILYLEC